MLASNGRQSVAGSYIQTVIHVDGSRVGSLVQEVGAAVQMHAMNKAEMEMQALQYIFEAGN